jgi:hypothetical protein
LAVQRSRTSIFGQGGFVYAIGGINSGSQPLPDIEVATINKAGDSIGSFQALTPMADPVTKKPVGVIGPTIVTTSDMLYVIGGAGDTSNTPVVGVYMTHLHADGTIDTWSAGPQLPSALRGAGAFARNGMLYVIGGSVTTTSRTAQVLVAHIGSDGSLDSWTPEPAWKLPTVRSDFGMLVY